MDSMKLFEVIYAIAAKDGREAVLFGDSFPKAREAFAHSVAGDYFPELWFELPCSGDPWFDLHALTAREDVSSESVFEADICGGFPDVFKWFASQDSNVRQLALSWDTGLGSSSSPAVQLLRCCREQKVVCDFLAVAGRLDAQAAYCAFEERLPSSWFACYAGVFPQRNVPFLRVECIPQHEVQLAYANDPVLLADHLRQVGLTGLGDTIVPRCQILADTPFQLEFQFDVSKDGRASSAFSASVRFSLPVDDGEYDAFDADGHAGVLMKQVQAWGLADERWRLISDTMFCSRISRDDESMMLYSYPAFLKLRWRDGEPVDAKVYLIAGVQDGGSK